MLDESNLPLSLQHLPLPSLLLNPREDLITDFNDDAAELFSKTLLRGAFSKILKSSLAEMVVFLDAVSHFGQFIDRSISLTSPAGTPLRLQVFGHQLDDTSVLLSFLDLDDLDRRNEKSEFDAHQRDGITKWRNFYRFFQEVEAQNHLILEAAGEGIYGINAEGKATFVNRAAQEMLGWSADDLIGRDLHSTIHHKHLNGEHFPNHTCPIYKSFRQDKTVRSDDDVFWRKDGKPITVEYVSTPIHDHGVLAGAVVIFRDVTERRENERQLREALQEVETLRDKLEQENDYLLTQIRSARSHTGIVGVSDAIKALNTQIDLLAKSNAHALISGPAGSGKELAVTAIHEASERKKRPLVRVNCHDNSDQMLDRELFGYRRGAFSGADRDQTGKILMANNGTLHLDEVCELPKGTQAKLYDVIQTSHLQRFGDNNDIPVSLTVIATSSRDLLSEVRAGRFRQDLYFALTVFAIQCQPLSDRPEDIPYLAKHFLDRSTRRLRLPQTSLTRANINALEQYSWPGNIRELENVIERAAILAQGARLKFDFQLSDTNNQNASDTVLTSDELKALERKNLENALLRTKGKISGKQGAAKLLGMAATTVYSKVKSFDLDPVQFKSERR